VASPIAHSLAGFWTFLLLRAQFKIWIVAQWRPYLLKLAVLIFLANLPDLDFFTEFGLHANELHRGFTHSLAAAIVVSLGLSCLWRIVPGFWRSALLYYTAYGSHLLIDLCTGSKLGWTHSSYGIPLFWPWHQEFGSPLILAFGVRHKNLSALFSIDNAESCAYELVIFGAITLVLLSLWKRKQKSRTNQLGLETGAHRHSELQYH
jgi:LexA-binding, inner membrane-associated putative hydrolase